MAGSQSWAGAIGARMESASLDRLRELTRVSPDAHVVGLWVSVAEDCLIRVLVASKPSASEADESVPVELEEVHLHARDLLGLFASLDVTLVAEEVVPNGPASLVLPPLAQ